MRSKPPFSAGRRIAASVDESWRYFFEGFELGCRPGGNAQRGCPAQIGVVRLIHAYRSLGHFLAHLDPLSDSKRTHPLLELDHFGLEQADLDRMFDTSPFIGLPVPTTLRELIAALARRTAAPSASSTCTSRTPHIRRWLQERMEPRRNRPSFDRAQKLRILRSFTTPSCSSASCTPASSGRSVSPSKEPRR